MLELFLPDPRLVESDHVDVGASQERAYLAFRHYDASRSPLIRTLFNLRTLPDRLLGHEVAPPRLDVDAIGGNPAPGFRILADEPGHLVTIGAIGKVWIPEIPFVDVPKEQFAAFSEPGYAKVVWELRAEPRGAGSRIVLDLRVGATDDESWVKTRRYLRLIGPFSRWIRRHSLALLAEDLVPLETFDCTRTLPGDALLPEVKAVLTLGIDIQATPAEIWPYLVQMGGQRAGWYSYDALDHKSQESAWDIVPELQNLKVGDIVAALPDAEGGYEVLEVTQDRSLVIGGLYDIDKEKQLSFFGDKPPVFWQVTWAFVLEQIGERETKLLARVRADFAPPSMKWKATWMAPVHHFMEMEQLRNIKARAEHQRHEPGLIDRAGAWLRDATS